jgi:lipopolysaccharide export system protein LptA
MKISWKFPALVAGLILHFCGGLWAQNQIELIEAGNLEGRGNIRYVKPSAQKPRVIFKRDDALLYCDLALQFPDTKDVHAFGNVQIRTKDGATVDADTIYYHNASNTAELRGRVVLIDDETILRTTQLFYDLNTRNGYYLVGGRVTDATTILTSKKGYYRAFDSSIAFKGDVFLYDTKDKQELRTDTLTYYTITKDAFFHTYTTITDKDGILSAQKGKYNTLTKVPEFEGNAQVENEKYILKGEKMYSDRASDYNWVRDNVELFSKEEELTVFGDEMIYREEYGNSKVYADKEKWALMRKPFGENDTLYVAADTLFTVNDTINNIRRLHAYYDVKLFSNELQGRCDSLIYDYNDSTITFLKDPVLWNANSQIKAERIVAYLSNNEIDSMRLTTRAFVIQRDTLNNYNQIKGRNMIAYFESSQIRTLDVNGNSQTLYFVLEADTLLTGMNKIDCGSMVMHFADSSKLSSMVFRTKPEAKFTPAHEILEPDTRLPDFRLRFKERPEKGVLISREKPQQPARQPSTTKPLPAMLPPGTLPTIDLELKND